MPAATDLSPSQRVVLRAFTAVAVVEAFTWTGLLVGMYFKYLHTQTTELGVQLFGPLHGGAFVAYLVMTALAWRVLRWSPTTLVAALGASIPPLCTVLFEWWAARTGRLTPRCVCGGELVGS